MKRFVFKHVRDEEQGFACVLRLGNFSYGVWLGYGKPIWWLPKFIGRGSAKYGFGFGWLLLCLRFQIFDCREVLRNLKKGVV